METLSKETRRKLAKLEALERGGVDNWEWYDEALKDLVKEEEKEEQAKSVLEEVIAILSSGVEEPAGQGCGIAFSDKVLEDALYFLIANVGSFVEAK